MGVPEFEKAAMRRGLNLPANTLYIGAHMSAEDPDTMRITSNMHHLPAAQSPRPACSCCPAVARRGKDFSLISGTEGMDNFTIVGDAEGELPHLRTAAGPVVTYTFSPRMYFSGLRAIRLQRASGLQHQLPFPLGMRLRAANSSSSTATTATPAPSATPDRVELRNRGWAIDSCNRTRFADLSWTTQVWTRRR